MLLPTFILTVSASSSSFCFWYSVISSVFILPSVLQRRPLFAPAPGLPDDPWCPMTPTPIWKDVAYGHMSASVAGPRFSL
jgi:hypothetical protein